MTSCASTSRESLVVEFKNYGDAKMPTTYE